MNNPSILISGEPNEFHHAPSVIFPPTAIYPSSFMSTHYSEPRRSVSNPLPPSHRSPSPSSSQYYASPERTALQLLGHGAICDHDVSLVRELILLHESELRDLRARYENLRAIHTRASDAVDTLRKHHKDTMDNTHTHAILSAQATSDLALESRQALEGRIVAVETLLHKYKGILHPIRKLPPEILAIILEYAIEFAEQERVAAMLKVASGQLQLRSNTLFGVDSDTSPVSSTFPSHLNKRLSPAVLLSSVCTHWRDVAHGLPSLWRTIHFRLTGPSNDSRWDRVRNFVDRGKRSPPSAEQLEMVTGISLVFTGWEEHKYPPVEKSFKKVMQMVRKGVMEDDWSEETPSHSRRQSSADTPVSSLGGLTGLPVLIDSPTLQIPASPQSHTFAITRLEIVFNTLCNHHRSLITGTESNSELHWPSDCPKPKEVVMIAKDTVYTTSCIRVGEDIRTTQFLIPPYAASLIPYAESVTLVNLQFTWPSIDKSDAYQSLTSLTLVYTIHYDNLLRQPQDRNDLGFLQFLRSCHNLKDLEVRLAPSKSGHVTTNGNIPNGSTNGGPLAPATWDSSLNHLSISLDDLGRISPLICGHSTAPSAPIVRFPSLHRLTILPAPPQVKATKDDRAGSWKATVRRFLLITEAPIRHLELRGHPRKVYPNYFSTHGSNRLEMEALLGVIQEVHGCEILEMWGSDIAQSVLDVLRMSTLQVNGASEDVSTGTSSSEADKIGCPPISDTVPASRASPTPPRMDYAPPPGSSSIPPTSYRSRLRRKHTSASPSPTPSHTRKKRISFTEDLVGRLIASMIPSKKRSTAIVATPEGTPRISSNEIPNQDDHEISGAAGSVTVESSPRVRVQSFPTGRPLRMMTTSTTSAGRHSNDLMIHSEPEGMEVESSPPVVLPGFKKLLVHDAEMFTPAVAAQLAERAITTVIYG